MNTNDSSGVRLYHVTFEVPSGTGVWVAVNMACLSGRYVGALSFYGTRYPGWALHKNKKDLPRT